VPESKFVTYTWGVAVSPGGDNVYVSNVRGGPPGSKGNTVSVIDTSTNVEVTTLPPVGQNPSGLVATASNVYVAHRGSDIVSVIDI
jgi:YVTN family beta-propeller protein